MNKEQLLQALETQIEQGTISREEVSRRLSLLAAVSEGEKSSHSFSLTKTLYVIGGAVVLIGIVIFVSQVWAGIGMVGHIAVTLGLGLLMTAIGSYLIYEEKESMVAMIFHIIGGLLIPGGAMVTLSEFSQGINSPWPVAITFGVIFLFYFILTFVHETMIIVLFAIMNATIFLYQTVAALIDSGLVYNSTDTFAYLTMVIGISYLLLGYHLRHTWHNLLVTFLYIFGTGGFLGAVFYQVIDHTIAEILYFVVVIGGLALAVYLKSRSILIVSTGFLVMHLIYMTNEYFADSVGWPIALVVLGFMFIGLGYVSIMINKKYIKGEK